ncbi:PREDICTED: uncharacterized protein LOC100640438 isoform X2 [Amphimedon queenslandica]|uniref:Stathmin n=1 Tax=Amphimedon queenslandica TaxID=400682 RepID=A0AAN0K5C3_AMPQE|nr:PREDICTED: uncharacterized protein LOC100640438 isoform X2 [Amphimedon queenslandica]|eukprot:XP_019864454.1 PREDICTED: uncharacterized protein LOC100640438 isoform X2 [Amphimedon queenslandica]
MGCGTSKASEIDEKCINIKPSPKKGQTESNQEGHVKSDHVSNGNDAAMAPVANGSETVTASDPTNKYPPAVAFDVPLNEDGTPMEKKTMPRKLQKISVSLTKEQLEEKQKAVLERKEKELKKRKESCGGRRASRIRREIMDARTDENPHNDVSGQMRNQFDNDKDSLSGNIEVDNTYNSAISEEDIWNDKENA